MASFSSVFLLAFLMMATFPLWSLSAPSELSAEHGKPAAAAVPHQYCTPSSCV